jgi:hypothetical protein
LFCSFNSISGSIHKQLRHLLHLHHATLFFYFHLVIMKVLPVLLLTGLVLVSEGFSRQSVLSKKKNRNKNIETSWSGAVVVIHSTSISSRLYEYAATGHAYDESSSSSSAAAAASLMEKTPTATPFLSSTRLYERIADKILDIVLLDLEDKQQPSAEAEILSIVEGTSTKNQAQQQKKYFQEQQVLWIEQLSKIMTASGKTLWSQARMRSGVLPSGRTVLGTIVDPLGVFLKEEQRPQAIRPAAQVARNTYQKRQPTQEDRAVFLTRQLMELIHQNVGEEVALSPNNPLRRVASDLPSPSELTRPQLVTFSRILSAKIWDRRVELVRSSNRFWKQMVSLQAQRSTKRLAMASGERLLQGIPVRNERLEESGDSSGRETERLQAARNFLEYYQSDDAEERAMSSVRTTL